MVSLKGRLHDNAVLKTIMRLCDELTDRDKEAMAVHNSVAEFQ